MVEVATQGGRGGKEVVHDCGVVRTPGLGPNFCFRSGSHGQRVISLLALFMPAFSNIPDMSVTLEVTKLSGWSNSTALSNIPDMSVTLEVTNLSGWLNATAYANIPDMVLTLEVSQLV